MHVGGQVFWFGEECNGGAKVGCIEGETGCESDCKLLWVNSGRYFLLYPRRTKRSVTFVEEGANLGAEVNSLCLT